jgi:hypothetical protein
MKAVLKRSWIVPVSCSNIPSVITWDASAVDDNSKDDESQYGDDLDHRQDEFDLTISSDTKDLYANEEH